jgi:hypothetical protein
MYRIHLTTKVTIFRGSSMRFYNEEGTLSLNKTLFKYG